MEVENRRWDRLWADLEGQHNAAGNLRWDRLRAAFERDVGSAEDWRAALEELGVDASNLEFRALELVRERMEDALMVEHDTERNENPAPSGPPIEITEVRVTLKSQGRLRALCSVTLGGVFVIRGIKVIEGPDRFFLAMPSRREADGKYRDVCHPVSTPFRGMLEERVVEEFHRKLGPLQVASRDGRSH